ncbi:serine/threonine protein kinase, partial [Acidobacteriota bacterium]
MVDVPGIPGYKIEKKLGEGGMAAVFLGIQEKSHRKVALKILDPSMLKHKVFELRFLHEAETAANMDHANIISIYDIGRVGDYCYMVMEYLKESLKERLLGYPGFKLKPDLAWNILKPIAEALGYAHNRGIIHRDIKPDNIMFREDGTPVLTDFGIARALDSNIRMTRSGISVGTPYYMSPEQCKAEKVDGRSDIYSLGVVLFEILTGQKPYGADNPMAVALKHIQEPVPQLPLELRHYQPLIDKMMAKRKEDRAASCEELLERIDY